MKMISEKDEQTIRAHFEANLDGNVEIVFFTEPESLIIIPGNQPCETCKPTEQLLTEVAALSDKVTLTVHQLKQARDEAALYGIDRVPAFVVKGAGRGQMRFYGIPSGYEFSAFIADLVDASQGKTGLSEETRLFLSTLTEDVNIKVFTTPT